jgi:choline dehydrogenase-like flavoprotein
MGTLQSAGYIKPLSFSRRYRPFISALLHNSFHTFVMSESIPGLQTGFVLSDTEAHVLNPPRENRRTFMALRQKAIKLFRRAGFRVFAPRIFDHWHWVGSARMGADPSNSIVDSSCKAHDVEGLYVVDASTLPSAGALNTGLTIAAVSLRAASLVPP